MVSIVPFSLMSIVANANKRELLHLLLAKLREGFGEHCLAEGEISFVDFVVAEELC